MSAALCALLEVAGRDPKPYKNLIPSFVSILKQVCDRDGSSCLHAVAWCATSRSFDPVTSCISLIVCCPCRLPSTGCQRHSITTVRLLHSFRFVLPQPRCVAHLSPQARYSMDDRLSLS